MMKGRKKFEVEKIMKINYLRHILGNRKENFLEFFF